MSKPFDDTLSWDKIAIMVARLTPRSVNRVRHVGRNAPLLWKILFFLITKPKKKHLFRAI
jgi:hypothetical protein